jgi:four helix bundle protein
MLSHQKLKVYGKGLAVVASLAKHSAAWDKRHAVVDQLCRASESIVLNLAEATRLDSPPQKQQLLDYAVGSALECAACLDIAVIKEFLLPEPAALEKRSLCEVVRMLIGLRRSWEKNVLREEPPAFDSQPNSEPQGWYFAHEPLEVYQVGLSFMRWFNGLPAGAELSSRLYRQVDKAATSVILNIAEGYGRTGAGDRLRFLEMAEGSAVKAAAYLDLCGSKAELDAEQRLPGLELLGRVVLMLRALSGSRSE